MLGFAGVGVSAAALRTRRRFRPRVRLWLAASLGGVLGSLVPPVTAAVGEWVLKEPEPTFEITTGGNAGLYTLPSQPLDTTYAYDTVTLTTFRTDSVDIHGATHFCGVGGDSPSAAPEKELGSCREPQYGAVLAREAGGCMRLFACDGKKWRGL